MLADLLEKETEIMNSKCENVDDEIKKEDDMLLIKNDKEQINSMIKSVNEIIRWIETGVNPYFQQGYDEKYKYGINYFESMDILPDIMKEIREEREELVLTEENKQVLKQVFRALSEREADCMVLHIGQRHSLTKTGEMLGIEKSTVNTHVMRAKKKIDKIVQSM